MITTIILNLIIIDFLIKLFIGTFYFYIYNRNQPLNLFKYKIDSFFFSWLFSIFYISIFIIIIQLLRIYNVNKNYDLKVLYFYVKMIYYNINLINLIYIILFFMILLFIILIILNRINNFFTTEIFKLLIYYYYKPTQLITDKDRYLRKIVFWLQDIHQIDIITHYLYLLLHKVTVISHGKGFDYRKLPKYHPYIISLYLLTTKYNKYYNLFIILSPLYVIIYDCIYNDFIVSHLYQYLIFYTPIMILRKITMFVARKATFIIMAIWPVFYDPKPSIYALSKDINKILNFYLKDNLGNNGHILFKNGLKSDFDLPITLEQRIYYNIEFIPHDSERNTFRNIEGVYLRMLENGKVFQELENPDIKSDIEDEYMYLGEEWILLADKTGSVIKWNYNYDKFK